jgi:2-phosphosulfolactate phosphatase
MQNSLVQIYKIPVINIFVNFTAYLNSPMDINILEFTEGAIRATGVTVIIDVFRAFSVACYAFDSGASRVIAAGDVKDAFSLKKKYKNSVLVGERNEKKVEGFDFGNSPTEMLNADLDGVTVIHSTTAGTNGLVNAGNASLLLAASLVNAGATARYIRSLNPDTVSLVAMGYRASVTADEDILCARLIADRLQSGETTFDENISELRHSSGKRFFEPSNIEFSPPTDFFLCTNVDKFDFVLKAEKRFDGHVDILRLDI